MTDPTPYQMAAAAYLNHGWSPIPFPTGEKFPPATGYTGAAGDWVTAAHVHEWLNGKRCKAGNLIFAAGNIALRMPRNVIGIDVDAHSGKAGKETLKKAEKAWGKLPGTWSTSARAWPSGIRLYRVPEGLSWPESLRKHHGGGVELIRWDHRYAMVAPSSNPDAAGAQYHWRKPNGSAGDSGEGGFEFPDIDELTELPPSWVQGLTQGVAEGERAASASLNQDECRDWLDARPNGDLCAVMAATLTKYSRSVRTAGADGGAHDEARDGAWALVGDSAAGHVGIVKALSKLKDVFLGAVGERRGKRLAREEWARIVIGGVERVVAEGTPEESDACEALASAATGSAFSAGYADATDGLSLHNQMFSTTDLGQAQRFVLRHGADVRYVPSLGGWHQWNGARWMLDEDEVGVWGRAFATAVEVGESEAPHFELDDPDRFVKLKKHSVNHQSVAKVANTLLAARKQKGIVVGPDTFDMNPELMLVGNGVIELLGDGWKFREGLRTDYMTQIAACPYVKGDHSELWEEFLAFALPDPEVRAWVQTVVGYSLWGGNPERLFILCEGRTSTGKSTFAETIRVMLGEHAAPFNLTLLRSQKDQGSDVQLVRLMPKRMIIASEASSEWRLHADQVKRVTGSEALNGRLNFANNMIERVPSFTPWVVTNAAPTIEGADQALWRRLVTIPFTQQLLSKDVDAMFSLRLQDPFVRSGVLNWALEGWRRYAAHGLRDMPAAVVEATLITRTELSEFDVFLSECCESGSPDEYKEQTRDLYSAYTAWSDSNGSKVVSLTGFGQSLGRRGYEKQMLRVGVRADDRKVMFRMGIRLNVEWSKRAGK